MRRFWVIVPLFAFGCDQSLSDQGDFDNNQIVFGIEQRADVVTADYDVIGLDGHGGSVATAFRDGDGDGQCWFERTSDRLGKPHLDNGVATWTGGSLPRDGVLVQANQPAATAPAPGWATGDALSFLGEGFAMPPITRVNLRAPLAELTITAVTPATMALTPSTDVGIAWTPPAPDTSSDVLVSLETATSNVRCFNRVTTGTSIVPAKWIAQLFDSPTIAGHLTIASHEQVTLIADGGWTVYVVATSVHRDIAFTGTHD